VSPKRPNPGYLRGFGTGWALVAVGLLAVPACQRKAPGPQECHRFALQVHGIDEDAVALPPPVKAVIDEVTIKCLTTPFDRELLRCVDEGRGAQRCVAEYNRRVHLRTDEERRNRAREEF
jgi:hypothetical protein